jgi:hypothetical protein
MSCCTRKIQINLWNKKHLKKLLKEY